MKFPVIIMFFVSSIFSFELGVDTISNGERKTLFVNASNDSVYFDSAKVELIKSEVSLYQMNFECFYGGKNKGFHFWNYEIMDEVNVFRIAIGPNDSVEMRMEELNYCITCVPENVKRIYPPRPMQAKMTFFTNIGNDSLIVKGLQTNEPYNSASIMNRNMPQTKPIVLIEYYSITGRRLSQSSLNNDKRSNRVGIVIGKSSNGEICTKKRHLLR